MIRINQLSFKYDRNGPLVLDDIETDIQAGEYVAMIGANGSGKTTFIRHLNGLLKPDKGTVLVNGLDTRDQTALSTIRQKVGMVFQNPDHQIVGMTVEEDVAFGPMNLGLSSREIRERVDTALTHVGLPDYGKRATHALSSGEKQLVAIAGVLAMEPEYIVLDEPTSYLDPSARKRVLQVIKEFQEKGMTILHATHEIDAITEVGRLIVLDKGRIQLDGTPGQVFGQADVLKGLGLPIPRVTELILRLRSKGLDLRTDIYSLDDACAELALFARKIMSLPLEGSLDTDKIPWCD